MSEKRQRVLDLLAEWKKDPYEFAEQRRIQITVEAGRDPAAGALRSIAERVYGPDGWVVEEVFGGDPVLIELR